MSVSLPNLDLLLLSPEFLFLLPHPLFFLFPLYSFLFPLSHSRSLFGVFMTMLSFPLFSFMLLWSWKWTCVAVIHVRLVPFPPSHPRGVLFPPRVVGVVVVVLFFSFLFLLLPVLGNELATKLACFPLVWIFLTIATLQSLHVSTCLFL